MNSTPWFSHISQNAITGFCHVQFLYAGCIRAFDKDKSHTYLQMFFADNLCVYLMRYAYYVVMRWLANWCLLVCCEFPSGDCRIIFFKKMYHNTLYQLIIHIYMK